MTRVSLREHVMRRVVEPTVVRFYQWRGDPVARLMQPGTVRAGAARAAAAQVLVHLRHRG